MLAGVAEGGEEEGLRWRCVCFFFGGGGVDWLVGCEEGFWFWSLFGGTVLENEKGVGNEIFVYRVAAFSFTISRSAPHQRILSSLFYEHIYPLQLVSTSPDTGQVHPWFCYSCQPVY